MVYFNLAIATVTGLLPIANPFSTAALFLGITKGVSPEERRRQAFMGCVYMFVILTVFLILGTLIMEFFGISIPGLRIAGGIMVMRVAMSMLKSEDERNPEDAKKEAREKSDISFTPLAMPSLSGPGAIAVTIGMASEVSAVIEYIAILGGIFIVSIICWLCLRASSSVVKFLGNNGLNVVGRIMGFLLLCVGVQFIVNGITGIVVQEEFLRRIAEAYHAATM